MVMVILSYHNDTTLITTISTVTKLIIINHYNSHSTKTTALTRTRASPPGPRALRRGKQADRSSSNPRPPRLLFLLHFSSYLGNILSFSPPFQFIQFFSLFFFVIFRSFDFLFTYSPFSTVPLLPL